MGLPGDDIYRYGPYAHFYPDFGIHWPKSQQDKHHRTAEWDPAPWDVRVDRTMTVPPNHVWVEGDCPPFSLDSRQYGPISMDYLCGRLVLRLWPWTDSLALDGLPSRSSLWLRRMERPIPFASADDYLGKRFNFYKIHEPDPKQQQAPNNTGGAVA